MANEYPERLGSDSRPKAGNTIPPTKAALVQKGKYDHLHEQKSYIKPYN
jgi:hypothetical protein